MPDRSPPNHAVPYTPDLFPADGDAAPPVTHEPLAPGALLLRGRACSVAATLLADLRAVLQLAPLRHLVTPGGYRMSVAMTNCGPLGWVSDATGYRYDANDPRSGHPWPPLPASFQALATQAAHEAGFDGFVPDACLVNRYEPGARLSLHQDRDERDHGHPIVSVSLGLPATFLFGGLRRTEPTARIPLAHGDVVVWGGPSRLRYHGVLALKEGHHAATGRCRINLTFRRAG
jgi:alkylated DNA repair protein (DNA oxidative demethylase)